MLDGLRGAAVLLVMLMHTDLVHNGFIGVDLFFGLSGFLITVLLLEEWDRSHRISFRRFYERRARRLLPALVLVLCLLLVVDACCYRLTGWSLEAKTLTSLLFVNNWVAGLGGAHDLGSLTPTWSLAQEEQFYLIWPLTLWLLLRRGVRPQMIVAALAAVIIAALAISPLVAAHFAAYNDYFSPLDRSAELLAGCAAALIWRYRMLPDLSVLQLSSSRLRALLERAVPWVREAFAWALVYLFATLLIGGQAPFTRGTYLASAALGIPLLVTLIGVERGLLARLLCLAPLRFVGRISYALYLFHLLVRNVVYHYLPHGSVLINATITFAISLALASASWYLVESRILAGGSRRPAASTREARAQAGARGRSAVAA